MIFMFNIVLAVLTVIGYFLPFLAPKLFPFLSVFSLLLPSLLIINLVFLLYWLILVKRQVWLSFLILLLGFTSINKFYRFSGKNLPEQSNDVTLMSYNVRLFNLFEWIKDDKVSQNIKEFVEVNDPDVLALQEYSKNTKIAFKQYPYSYIVSHGNKIKTGQAIFSKYRIIDKGEIKLPNSNNNVIFADILVQKDTIRIYSIHLQSISIGPDIHENVEEIASRRIIKRISQAFSEQQLQSELIRSHMDDASHRKIICGDMNNSAFSYVYRNVKGDLQDAFVQAGQGFGKTYDFDLFPMRIDYIFVDPTIEVKSFKTMNKFVNSDHFPLFTRLSIQRAVQ